MFYGHRRSLRSDKTSFISGPQMSSDTGSWKNSLPSRRQSIPPISNGHHLRSTKLSEKATKTSEQSDCLEVLYNGVNASHCYGTRYGGKNTDQNQQNISPTRKDDHWDSSFSGRRQHCQTTSSLLSLTETNQLTQAATDLSHKLRSRHVCFSNNLVSIKELEDASRQVCTKHYEAFSLVKDFQESNLSGTEAGSVLNTKDAKDYKNLESKHCQNQRVKRKRLTAEEKLIQDNKAYYKLEVKNNKLRSSGYYLYQKESCVPNDKESKTSDIEIPGEVVIAYNGEQLNEVSVRENADVKPVHTVEGKRNKIRLSELSLLNNEAENFMFGETTVKCKSDDDSSEENVSDDKNNRNSYKISGLFSDSALANPKNNTLNLGSETSENRSSTNESGVVREENNQTECGRIESTQNFDCKYIYSRSDLYKKVHFEHEISFQRKNDNLGQDVPHCEENSFQFCSLSSNEGEHIEKLQRKHKRQTHIERFLNDNIGAYKFEVSGVEPCIQLGTFSHSSPKMQNKFEIESKGEGHINSEHKTGRSENNINVTSPCTNCGKRELQSTSASQIENDSENKNIKIKCSPEYSDVKNETITELHFSFEAVPESEPWYQTYQRQDEGEEFYLSSVNDCTYWKSFLLPYEMPLEQFSTPGSGVSILKSAHVGNVKRRKRKVNSSILDKKPRKSPRCHASTLAILSSLMHTRKKKESEKSSDDGISRKIEENDMNDAIAIKANDTPTHRGIKELAQNIDQLLGLCTEIGLSSDAHTVPTNDVKDEVNCGKGHKLKTLKCKRPPKVINLGHTQRNEIDKICMKDSEGTDVDPVILEEMADIGQNPLSCVDDASVRNRGGPCMDVISLLNGYGTCYCLEELMKCKDMPKCESDLLVSSREACNSECVSSTCETIQYSDITENVIRMRGKKRKRKKNLTGWPIEKQKIKRRLLLKLARPEVQAPVLGKEVKDGNERQIEGDGETSSVPELNNKCMPCVALQDCSAEQVILSEIDDNVSCNRSNFNEVRAENRNTINTRCIQTVDSDVEVVKSSDNEYMTHSEVSLVTSPLKTIEKLCISRTATIDSNSQHCDFQPRVRVKKINSVADVNFVLKSSDSTPTVNNTRQLRSTFASGATLMKNLCHYDSVDTVEVVRRASARMKKSFSRWDSWSTRRRR